MSHRSPTPKQVFFRVLGWSQLFTLWLVACAPIQGDWRLALIIGFSGFVPTLFLAAVAAYVVRSSRNVDKAC